MESSGSPLLNWAGDEPFTVSIWLKPDALRAQGNHIMGNIPARVGDNQWHVSLLERGHPRFHVGQVQQEGAIYADGSTPLRAGEWAHVAGVSDGRAITIFLNGIAIGASVLTPRAIGRRPESARLRLGTASLYAQWAYSGSMDELRIWRRALSRPEIASLASREAPPRLLMTGGTYTEKDDLPAAISREFGAEAALADWDEIRRWYADDVGAFCDEIGLEAAEGGCMVQRAGKRFWEEPRHYMIGRWNGTKPAYYLAHEELGGFTLALGSWYGLKMRALARLPYVAPRAEALSAGASGSVEWKVPEGGRALAMAISWRATLSRNGSPVRCEVRLHDGRTLVATLAPIAGDKVALLLGDAKEPVVSRQFAAGWGDFRIMVVARDGMIRFRAVNAMGGALLFQEEVRLPTLRMADIAELVLPSVARAELIVE